MSQTTKDPEDLSNRELLERVAALDEETCPVAKDAQRALDQYYSEEESS